MKPEIGVYEVKLHQPSNNLDAMIQVVASTPQGAKNFVLRKFFRNTGSWQVTSCEKLRDV